jgi:hypothetical protein
MSGLELEFMGIIWSYIGPTCTSKNTKTRVIRSRAKEFMDGCIIGKQFCGGAINKKSGYKEGLIPIFDTHECMGKQGKPHLHNVTMLAFSGTILLMSVGARDVVRDANGVEKRSLISHTHLPNRIEWK